MCVVRIPGGSKNQQLGPTLHGSAVQTIQNFQLNEGALTNTHEHGGKKLPSKLTNKSPAQQNSNPSPTVDSPSSSGLDQEAEDKFELELYWCIQQLELGINSGKLNDKQLRSTQKNLDTLKSNKIALVQKRQLMRNTFGDYRAKMIQEEKKHGKTVSSVKLSTPKSNENKSIFIKKLK